MSKEEDTRARESMKKAEENRQALIKKSDAVRMLRIVEAKGNGRR